MTRADGVPGGGAPTPFPIRVVAARGQINNGTIPGTLMLDGGGTLVLAGQNNNYPGATTVSGTGTALKRSSIERSSDGLLMTFE
jgi:autotransporter-associated beta strand protein